MFDSQLDRGTEAFGVALAFADCSEDAISLLVVVKPDLGVLDELTAVGRAHRYIIFSGHVRRS